MAGIKQWNKNVEVAANPSRRIAHYDLTNTTVLTSGQGVNVDVFAPAGYIAQVVGLSVRYSAPVGATSGKLVFGANMVAENLTTILRFMYAEANFDKYIFFEYGRYGKAADATPDLLMYAPRDPAASAEIFKQYYDENSPLRFSFANLTDVSDAGMNKEIQLWVIEEKIGGI